MGDELIDINCEYLYSAVDLESSQRGLYVIEPFNLSFLIRLFLYLHSFLLLKGPILLEDYHLVEKLAQFDRERIPERVVHARGASAKGFFEVTHDISHLTCADFLRAPGVQTPVIVRFSTVIHERGSPETLRDPRGFAVKFYTREVCPDFFFFSVDTYSRMSGT